MSVAHVVDVARLAVPWALRPDGKVVHLKGYYKQDGELLCGGCRKPVVHRQEAVNGRVAHFAHKADGSGGCGYMTLVHALFRDALAELLNERGWVRDGVLIRGVATAEKWVDDAGRRPDVAFVTEGGGPKLAFEIIRTSGLTNKKIKAMHEAGWEIIARVIQPNELDLFEKCDTEQDMMTVAKDHLRFTASRFRVVSERPERHSLGETKTLQEGGKITFSCNQVQDHSQVSPQNKELLQLMERMRENINRNTGGYYSQLTGWEPKPEQ